MFWKKEKVITRFPPSPTGPFHIGSARTALYNYIFAKQNGGKFLLRIEDTDKERSTKEFEKNIFDSLEWLGLNYDGEVIKQSERKEIYKEKIQELIKNGYAYISKETEGENKEVVRFKNPGGKIIFNDLIRGEIEMELDDLKDFIIARNIEEPVYHLTAVVDDILSGVTHVIRGEDHISNTPRQILILEALGGVRPTYAHLPLVLAQDKSKLSKRKHGESVSLNFYREAGYLKESIINFIALIGWNPGGEKEIYSIGELIKVFDIKRVQKGGAIFNIEKLDWMNKEYMKVLPEKIRNQEIALKLNELGIHGISDKIFPIIFDHISKWSDVTNMSRAGEWSYFWSKPNYPIDLLFWKGDSNKVIYVKNLEWIKDKLNSESEKTFGSVEKIKSLIMDYANQNGRGVVLWPLRVALSGKDKSPDPFTLLYVLGKEESLSRIIEAIKKLS